RQPASPIAFFGLPEVVGEDDGGEGGGAGEGGGRERGGACGGGRAAGNADDAGEGRDRHAGGEERGQREGRVALDEDAPPGRELGGRAGALLLEGAHVFGHRTLVLGLEGGGVDGIGAPRLLGAHQDAVAGRRDERSRRQRRGARARARRREPGGQPVHERGGRGEAAGCERDAADRDQRAARRAEQAVQPAAVA